MTQREKTGGSDHQASYRRERYDSRRKIKHQVRKEKDPVGQAIDLVQRYWTLGIVRALAAGPMRPSELELALGAPTESLRTALVQMIDNGLISHTRYVEFPPRVEYSLTERGRGLIPVVAALEEWAHS